MCVAIIYQPVRPQPLSDSRAGRHHLLLWGSTTSKLCGCPESPESSQNVRQAVLSLQFLKLITSYRSNGGVKEWTIRVRHNSLSWQILIHQHMVWTLPRCEYPCWFDTIWETSFLMHQLTVACCWPRHRQPCPPGVRAKEASALQVVWWKVDNNWSKNGSS